MADTTVSKETSRCSMSYWFFSMLQSKALLMDTLLAECVCFVNTALLSDCAQYLHERPRIHP